MGCSASSLLPINKAISPADVSPAPEGDEAAKKSSNGVNGSNGENNVQPNGVTKLPASIPEEVGKEEEKETSLPTPDTEKPVTATSDEKKQTDEKKKTDEKEVSEKVDEKKEESSSTEEKSGVENLGREEESRNGSGSKEKGGKTDGLQPDGEHETITNGIEPVSGTMATKAEEVTKPSTPSERKENPSEPRHEKAPGSPKKEGEEPVIIPVISDEVQPNLSNENQSLKLPDEDLMKPLAPLSPPVLEPLALPVLEPLAPLPELKPLEPLPKLEPTSILPVKIDPPSMKICPPSIPTSIEPTKIIEEAKETASTATVIADRLVSQIVPSVESMKKEADSLTNIFETKIKLVETKVTQKAEELKEMPEKIINDTIEKLSLELNSVTNDVLRELSSETEEVEPKVDQVVSKVDQVAESKPEAVSAVEEMINSIPVALNNVAANISSTLTEKIDEAGSCLALQLDSLGFDTEEFEVKSPSVTSSQVALPEAASSDPTVLTCSSSLDPTALTCTSSALASSLAPPAGFGVVASNETLENELDQEAGDENNAEGNESSNCKSKSGGGGNKKNRHKNRRNKNKSGSGRASSPPPTPETPLDDWDEILTGPRLLAIGTDETLDAVEPPETLIKIDEEEPSDSTTGSQLTVKSVNMNPTVTSTEPREEELLSETATNIVSLE